MTKYYCTARQNSPLFQKASTFTGPQLWPAALLVVSGLVFRCDCRNHLTSYHSQPSFFGFEGVPRN